MGTIIAKTLFGIGATLFTEKVLMNLLVILATWLARRTTNDLDDSLVQAIKEGLDKQSGQPANNLYDRVKQTSPVTK